VPFLEATAVYNATRQELSIFAVKPREPRGAALDGGRLSVRLPPLSWNVLRLAVRK